MSLKARIEAVIYAAEEPVTLAQLVSVFREEALASRAARVAAASDGTGAPAEAQVASEPVLAALAAETDTPTQAAPSEPGARNSADAAVATPDFAGEPQPAPEPAASGIAESLHSVANEAAAPSAQPDSAAVEAPSDAAADPEAEKKAARARDREARDEIRALLDELVASYNTPDRGIEIREVAGGFRFGTRPEYHDSVRAFIKSLKPPMKLSLQALETLAVIAYKQPVTAPEIGEIRGVDSGGVLGSLVARKLVTTAGRKQVIGRPILYKTTKEFLLRFGLKDLNELPSIEEFEKMAADLEDSEAASRTVATPEDLPFAEGENEPADSGETEPAVPGSDALPASESDPAPPAGIEDPAGDPASVNDPAPTSEHDVAIEENQP